MNANSSSGLEIQGYGREEPVLWQRDILYPQKLAPTLPTSGGRWVGIVRSPTNATEFSFFICRLQYSFQFILSCLSSFLIPNLKQRINFVLLLRCHSLDTELPPSKALQETTAYERHDMYTF
jgi:hypothetical protein